MEFILYGIFKYEFKKTCHFVPKRITVSELPGKVRLNPAPINFISSVFGYTFFGFSNVFSSSGLADLSTMAFPFPDITILI